MKKIFFISFLFILSACSQEKEDKNTPQIKFQKSLRIQKSSITATNFFGIEVFYFSSQNEIGKRIAKGLQSIEKPLYSFEQKNAELVGQEVQKYIDEIITSSLMPAEEFILSPIRVAQKPKKGIYSFFNSESTKSAQIADKNGIKVIWLEEDVLKDKVIFIDMHFPETNTLKKEDSQIKVDLQRSNEDVVLISEHSFNAIIDKLEPNNSKKQFVEAKMAEIIANILGAKKGLLVEKNSGTSILYKGNSTEILSIEETQKYKSELAKLEQNNFIATLKQVVLMVSVASDEDESGNLVDEVNVELGSKMILLNEIWFE